MIGIRCLLGHRGPGLRFHRWPGPLMCGSSHGPAIWHRSGNAPNEKALTAAFSLVRAISVLVGDTGFEPVTSSVSGKRAPTAPIARGGDGI